ncbi:hypothetical protein CKO15_06390 [Halorhodospira abdelmalekii]|uniref:glycosyltransferase family 4 protein n=1 Tax=Halorhodospira abdelmalekii TaxID=421629 RepID=UPI001903F3CB|nr:glycosyltransferase family 1 protein [Halorhodospira abdelmalekii]MBK1734920.1 hypothetical protein [Halorhodospira abdelmalekii]
MEPSISASLDPTALRRIAIVSETFAPEANGVATTLRHLTAELQRMGVAVDLVLPTHPARAHWGPARGSACAPPLQGIEGQPQRAVSLRGGSAPVGEVRLEPVTGVPLPSYRDVRIGLVTTRRLRKLWRQHRPDALYIATEGPLGRAALKAAEQLGIAAVTGFHTRFDTYIAHYLSARLQPLAQSVLRRFHNRAAKTLVPDAALAQQLAHAGYRHVALMRRGVDTTLFDPQRRCRELRTHWGAAPQTPVLLYTGRIAAEKNLALLARAFERVRAHCPQARCVVVGEGPWRHELKRLAPAIHFAGNRYGDDLARHYASADLFLFPSLSETFGNVTLEAMASGLPVVAFDYAAAASYVEDGNHGFLAPWGAEAEWVTAATTLAQLPTAQRRAMGLQARAAVAELAWQQIAVRFASILAEAMGAPPQHDGAGRPPLAPRGAQARGSRSSAEPNAKEEIPCNER